MATELSLADKIGILQNHCREADLNELNRIIGHLPEEIEPFTNKADAYDFLGFVVAFVLSDEQIEDLYNFAMNKE